MSEHAAPWGYDATNGPDRWADLDPSYAIARTGRRQSPIDLRAADATPRELPPITFEYGSWTIDEINLGHAIQIVGTPGSSIVVDSVRFSLEQFHFHTPSEHTLDGEHTAMEMHLVHKSAADVVAVVGVMIREGRANPAYDPICAHVPPAVREEIIGTATVRLSDLLPTNRTTFRYDGSFTTPPCAEGVAWFVLRTPVEMSRLQIDQFRRVVDRNTRPVQPLHGRDVLTDR